MNCLFALQRGALPFVFGSSRSLSLLFRCRNAFSRSVQTRDSLRTVAVVEKPSAKGVLRASNLESRTPAVRNSVENDEGCIAYCHALPSEWSERDLLRYLESKGTPAKSVRFVQSRMGRYTGRALVEFATRAECEKALAAHHENYVQSADVVQFIVMKPFHLRTRHRVAQVDTSRSFLYLQNLDYDCKSEDVYYLAADFGDVEYVDMPLRREGDKNKGYAFLKFREVASADALIRYLEENKFQSKTVRVQRQKYEFQTNKKRLTRSSDELFLK